MEAAAPASPLVCVHCGADVKHLTLDAQIIVTFRLNEAGKIAHLKNSSSEKELIERADEEGPDYKSIFCDECGNYLDIVYDEEGNIVGFKEQEPVVDNKPSYCPKCGKKEVKKGRGAFVEVGEYDEFRRCHEEEWDCHEYTCQSCGAKFAY